MIKVTEAHSIWCGYMLLFIIGAGFVRTSEQDYSLQTHAFLFLTKNISTLGLSGLANSLMKKIIFSLCMLMGTFCFSQTVTKKFNSYYNRYEYYDSSSNLIGYEKYNSYSGRWEYYSLKSPQQSRQPYQYKDPQELDISNLGNAATTLQNRYNNNQKNAQSVVDDILYQIKSLNISDDRKNRIIESFNKTVINNMESLYRGNVSWLYDAANTIIKNTK